MLDEIDKTSGHSNEDFGEMPSALLELLDPQQNKTFHDRNLDIDYDISHATFICTANNEFAIPAALRDRLEIIRLGPYTADEKLTIAETITLPRMRRDYKWDANTLNLPEEPFNISPAVLQKIIADYAPEPGIRKLEEALRLIQQKIAARLLSVAHPLKASDFPPISNDNLRDYLGAPPPKAQAA